MSDLVQRVLVAKRLNPSATELLATPEVRGEIVFMACNFLYFPAPGEASCATRDSFLGLELVHELGREFCASCGATAEPNRCSYCGTLSKTIQLLDDEDESKQEVVGDGEQ